MSTTGNVEQTQTGTQYAVQYAVQYSVQRTDDVNNEQGQTVHETVL
mgnify:FL=1